jgi:hypothetical protein
MPSLGKDLATIRNHLGLTIQDVQNATKIPLDTLKSIESGEIFDKSDEIITYVRSFVRTYGRALKLDEDLVTRALDQEEIGNYNHLLLRSFPELSKGLPADKSAPPKSAEKTDEKPKGKPGASAAEESDNAAATKKSSRFVADFPEMETDNPKSDTPKKEPATATAKPPNVRNVNWADMGRKFTPDRQKTPVWLIGAAVILIVILGAAWLLSQSGMFSPDDAVVPDTPVPAESTPPGTGGNGLQLDVSPEPPAEPEPAVLDDILYITVYAATGTLEPVRVWSDLKPRIDPYWIEQGVALNFEFRDTIRVRGQYQRMLLFLNGHLIENARQQYYNPQEDMVELTRDLFEAEPRWATPVPFELPPNVQEPDSVANRPAF